MLALAVLLRFASGQAFGHRIEIGQVGRRRPPPAWIGDEFVGGVWCLSRSAFDTPPVGVLQVLGFHHSVVVVKKRPQLGGTPGQSVEDVQHERGSLSDSYRYVRADQVGSQSRCDQQ